MPRRFINPEELKHSRIKNGIHYTKKTILLPALTILMMMLSVGLNFTPMEALAATTEPNTAITLSISQNDVPLVKANPVTFSDYWQQDSTGTWHIYDGNGNMVTNAWVCDDAVTSNGKEVWYLIDTNGNMISAPLVQDQTGNYYSLEQNHTGHYGKLRATSGTYDGIFLDLESAHNGSFAKIKNTDGVESLKSKYGLQAVNIDNNNIKYTSTFSTPTQPTENPSDTPTETPSNDPSEGNGNNGGINREATDKQAEELLKDVDWSTGTSHEDAGGVWNWH